MLRIEWANEGVRLVAREPSSKEVTAHAAALAEGYNAPANAALMGHTDPMTAEEVVEHYAQMAEEGAKTFLLFVDDALVGDGDLRNFADGAAEFAFMIASPGTQGRGLGTRFAQMIHACAFGPLGLHHVYASIVPHNVASRRVFEKIGYQVDASRAGRGFAEHPDDVVMSIDRAAFERLNAPALEQIRVRRSGKVAS